MVESAIIVLGFRDCERAATAWPQVEGKTSPMSQLCIQAAAIVVDDDRFFAPGEIVVANGQVQHVGRIATKRPDLHLPESVLSPGLVNAHTHLEFSDLTEPIAAGPNFPSWIGRVVQHRRAMMAHDTPDELLLRRERAIQDGLDESFNAGVAVLADIVTSPWRATEWTRSHRACAITGESRLSHASANNLTQDRALTANGLVEWPSTLLLPEVLGLKSGQLETAVSWAASVQQSLMDSPNDQILGCGVSPHSPYSMDVAKVTGLIQASSMERSLTAMHLAESMEELEWLATGTGPFAEVFNRLGVPPGSQRMQIPDIVDWLTTRKRSLIVHGNYLDSQSIAKISQAPNSSVIYCPRTHHFFGHTQYPLRELLDSGVRVAIGTDSRASNPDLVLWRDVRVAHQQHPWVRHKWLFRAVTVDAAEAIGCHRFGNLRPGSASFINVSKVSNVSSVETVIADWLEQDSPFQPLTIDRN